jgi:hypothetical protein
VGIEQTYHELSQRHRSSGTPSETLFGAGILMTLIRIGLCHSYGCLLDGGDADDSEVLFDHSSGLVEVATLRSNQCM